MFIMESSKVLGYRVQCRGGGAQSNVSYTLLQSTIHRFSLQYKGFKVKGVQSSVKVQSTGTIIRVQRHRAGTYSI